MVIARIESLILEKGVEDALTRAEAYVEAGADAVMIHSRRKEPDEIFEFCSSARTRIPNIPIVAVPTSYNSVTEDELAAAGVKVVIYANHLLRAAYPSMTAVAELILQNARSLEADGQIASISEVLNIIPENAQ